MSHDTAYFHRGRAYNGKPSLCVQSYGGDVLAARIQAQDLAALFLCQFPGKRNHRRTQALACLAGAYGQGMDDQDLGRLRFYGPGNLLIFLR